jgi:NADH dehydrogenase (ubiquinone) Fe-S protein 5
MTDQPAERKYGFMENPVQVMTPFFRSPFTDLTGAIINHQHYDKCGKLEMQMMECLEAYGMEMGKNKCRAVIEDFQECYTYRKQMLRTWVS